MDAILFHVFSALAVAAALLAVTRKNAVASACWLVVMFFGLAGVFVLLEAFFVAVVQILVYAGAIMVLFLFVIMLLDLRTAELESRAGPSIQALGVVLAGAVLAALVYALRDATDSPLVADRVAVEVRRPAVAPAPVGPGPTGADVPLGTASTPVVPPPPEAVPLAETDPAPLPAEPGPTRPPTGERAWSGTFAADVVPGAARRTVTVTVAPSGAVAIALDGTPLETPAWTGDAPEGGGVPAERRGSVDVPGSPAGTALTVVVVRGGLASSPAGAPDGSARGIGRALFEVWLLPFEIASVLLTGAIFGAVVLTKRRLA